MSDLKQTTLITAPSFEPRSTSAIQWFLQEGGELSNVRVCSFGGSSDQLARNVQAFSDVGVSTVSVLNRMDSRELWTWAWRTVSSSSGSVIVDISCLPREILAMLLFALSVRRDTIDSARICYTPPLSYVTQDGSLSPELRWLSRGIKMIRSVVGYPGEFSSDRKRHLVALAGHESERLLEIINYVEPTRLSISNEQGESGTVPGATVVSELVKAKVRESIGHPDYNEIPFYANSIHQTYEEMYKVLSQPTDENVALACMNTKLSFVGAALCALRLRHIRLVYAVPLEYNAHYSRGAKEPRLYNITELIRQATTIQVPQGPT